VRSRRFFPFLILALVFIGSGLVTSSYGAFEWPEGKARQALFIQLGERVAIYCIQPGMTRTEPIIEQVGFHDETRIVYIYQRPVFEVVPVPDYRSVGEKLFLNTAAGEKEFTNVRWKLIDIINSDGYPLLQARTDIENALDYFGLKFSDKKQSVIDSLLQGVKLTPAGESYTPVEEVPLK
jgi:hypothetical protein